MNTSPDSSPVQQGAETSENPQLARGLSLRHIMFIALGSAIGTGLFYGSASAIQLAPLRAACLRYWRRGSVYGDARNGRTRPGTPGLRCIL